MTVHNAEDVINPLETLILLLIFSDNKHPYQLKLALKCAVLLCEAKQDHCKTFVELLQSSLQSIDGKYITILVCQMGCV